MAKQNKKQDLTQLPDATLATQLQEARSNAQRLRINHAVSALENPNEIGKNKRQIARILTEVHRRELSLQSQKSEVA